MTHDTALFNYHRADKDFSALWWDLKIQIQSFYEFKRWKELDDDTVSWKILLHHEKRLFINYRGGDNMITIFEVNRLEVFRKVTQHNWHKTTRNFNVFTKSELLKFKVSIFCLVIKCVS